MDTGSLGLQMGQTASVMYSMKSLDCCTVG
jgi:hypothetical protein